MPIRRILNTWWPLAASWLLMGAELPLLSAVVARLPEPAINLAAYGGVVFPLALFIESPIIMLLAASTALSKDWASYRTIWRFMMIAGGCLTALHLLVVLTPIYYVIVDQILGVPAVIVEPARLGLLIMTPWTWSIAYRRFHQGVLIRFGHSQTVSIGTVIRLSIDALVLGVGYLIVTIYKTAALPGIAVATAAVAAGVLAEATYIGIVVRPVLRDEVRLAPPVTPALTYQAFFNFYIPLVLTSLLGLLAQPIGSAAVSRMPNPINSLAVWSVVTGLIFLLRSLGIAYNEVVVALLDEPHSSGSLWRFAIWLAGLSTAFLVLVAFTPLSGIWFSTVLGLNPILSQMAQISLRMAVILPALSVFQSWSQGAILYGKRTRGITEAVLVFLATSGLILGAGVAWGRITGLYVGILALVLSTLTQTLWLWYRSRPIIREVRHRDSISLDAQSAGSPAS